MKIAIITLNYNGKKDTLEFLESLGKLRIENGQLKIKNRSSAIIICPSSNILFQLFV